MHPLVHQWSRERMAEKERKQALIVAFHTIAIAIIWTPGVEIYQQYRSALPHMGACLYGAVGSLWEWDTLVSERVCFLPCVSQEHIEHQIAHTTPQT